MRVARPASPRPAPPPVRRAAGWWRAAGPVLALAVALSIALPAPAVAATTWTRNLFASKAFLYQDPYGTTCTAAATMIMLNTIAANGTGGPAFRWSVYRVKHNASDPTDDRDMTSIFAWERKRDTLRGSARGSDAHGWRNALNWYGWGTWQDPAARVYEDRAYRSFGAAVKAAVRAIARRGMPVGVLTWAGGHAQVMHGYTVTGADPAVSNDFTVEAVYLSDPLRGNDIVNRRVSIDKLRAGPLRLRFQRYRETDSPYDDPYSGGWRRSSVRPSRASSEWYGRWVLILPVRAGAVLPGPTPTPVPEPTPTPDPDPTPTPDPTSDPSTAPTPSLQAGDASLPSPTPVPTAPPSAAPDTGPASTEPPAAAPTAEPAAPTEPPSEVPAESASPGS